MYEIERYLWTPIKICSLQPLRYKERFMWPWKLNFKLWSKAKLLCLLFFNGRSRTQTFQWQHKWRLTIKNTIEDCKTVHVYTCWSKTTAWNVCKGCMSRDECSAFVTAGNQVSPLIKKGDFSVWGFSPGIFRRKKKPTTWLFNWQLQPQVHLAPFSHYLLQPDEKKSIISCIMVFQIFRIGTRVSLKSHCVATLQRHDKRSASEV